MKISDTRDLFMSDNLPDDFPDPLTIDEGEIVNYEEKMFIKQLRLIALKNNSLRNAISDFRRAFEQRSKWLRDNLIGIDEYDRFDKQLYDYWNHCCPEKFYHSVSCLGPSPSGTLAVRSV